MLAVNVPFREEPATIDRRRSTQPVLNAAAVTLALLTVLLALLFVAVVLVAAAGSSALEGGRAANVASAVGETFFGATFRDKSGSEPPAHNGAC